MLKDATDKLLLFCILMIGVSLLGHAQHGPAWPQTVIELEEVVITSDCTCHEYGDDE